MICFSCNTEAPASAVTAVTACFTAGASVLQMPIDSQVIQTHAGLRRYKSGGGDQ
jgi:hypothetical protein